MEDNNLKQLKENYMHVPVPSNLDSAVKEALKESGVSCRSGNKKLLTAFVSIAAVLIILIVGVNSSPAFAETLSKVPVIGGIVKVITFTQYTVDEDNYKADIEVPEVQGLENKALENSLNEKYLAENKKLYEQFTKDVEDLKNNGGGHMGVESGYVVKTDNDRILSIGHYVVNTVGSSSTTFRYDTIDKEKEVLLTLPILFKDDSYIDVISENIKEQMKEQMDSKSDPPKVYWVTLEGEEKPAIDAFDKISDTQNFYINADGKLVISFDKYEVAPGYMGVVEFTIPTEVISNILVGNDYIK